MMLSVKRGASMHHQGVEFEVIEVGLGRWRWTIYPKKKSLRDRAVTREAIAKNRSDAIALCKLEIDRRLWRQMNAQRP